MSHAGFLWLKTKRMKKDYQQKHLHKVREIEAIINDWKLDESDDKSLHFIDLLISYTEHFNKLLEEAIHLFRKNAEHTETGTYINPYPRIFINYSGFLLFEHLKNDVREEYKLADYSFIYRRMQKDGFIFKNVADTEFRDFLLSISVEIEKTKLLDYCKTKLKEKNYLAKKSLLQFGLLKGLFHTLKVTKP